MINYKYRYIVLTLMLCLLYSSAASAGIAEAFERIFNFLQSDILKWIALVVIMGVIFLTMTTQVLDWRKAGIILGAIAAAYSVLEVYGIASGVS